MRSIDSLRFTSLLGVLLLGAVVVIIALFAVGGASSANDDFYNATGTFDGTTFTPYELRSASCGTRTLAIRRSLAL